MKKPLITLFALLTLCAIHSCNKEDLNKGLVNYIVFGEGAPNYHIQYTVGNKDVIDTITSGWSFDFYAEEGDILKLGAKANDLSSLVYVRVYYENNLVVKDSLSGDYPEVLVQYIVK